MFHSCLEEVHKLYISINKIAALNQSKWNIFLIALFSLSRSVNVLINEPTMTGKVVQCEILKKAKKKTNPGANPIKQFKPVAGVK